MTISSAQCRAARALLDWTQGQLAENAHVSRATVADFERNTRTPMRNNLEAIIGTLETAGVAFIEENEKGAGVRFRDVEMEYNKNLKRWDGGLSFSVRYRGKSYEVMIPEEIADDMDKIRYSTISERVKSVENNFPVYLKAVENTILHGNITNNYIFLLHEKFPKGVF